MTKPYSLIQNLFRITNKHKKNCELMKPLFYEQFFTEDEMVANIKAIAEEGTTLIINCGAYDWNTCKQVRVPFGFTLNCDQFLKYDGTVDTSKLVEEYEKKKKIDYESYEKVMQINEQKDKSKGE